MSIFADTSALFAAFDAADAHHERSVAALSRDEPKITTDHVLVELWRVARRELGRGSADDMVHRLVYGDTEIEPVTAADIQVALDIGTEFPDQTFSLVDRTSFAVMRRRGLTRVATFDHHFAVYRFGPGRRRAFEIVR